MSLNEGNPKTPQLKGPTKAAVLMLCLGDGLSGQVFKRLNDDEVMRLSQEISRMGQIPSETSQVVLAQGHAQLAHGGHVAGSFDKARRMLESAFDADTAREFVRDISTAGEVDIEGLSMLQRSDPKQLAKLLAAEHPQTAAVVVSYLSSAQAARVVAEFEEAKRVDVCLRVAQMETVSAPVRDRVIGLIADRLDSVDRFHGDGRDGLRKVAEILNRMDRDSGRDCLENLEHEDPALALAIRNSMFVFEDILILGDTEMRRLIQNIDKQVLITALKGSAENLQLHFFRNMSNRAVQMLREDMDTLGPIRLKEVQGARREIVETVRELERTGMIDLDADGAEEYVS